MKIAIIAPIDERIPPHKYGGVGRVVFGLADGLVKKGHAVTLLASGDSRSRARIISIFSKSLGQIHSYQEDSKTREAYLQIATAKILSVLQKEKFDIVSNHLGWRLVPFYEFSPSPLVTTLHTPLNQSNKRITFKEYKFVPFISVSQSQRKPLPYLNYLATVYNGIDTALYRFSPKHRDYFVFLGRMSPEKGALEAIQIAKKLKIKLIMAGAVLGWDNKYFSSKIKPHIDGKNIQFIGEVDDRQKNILLGGAIALLAPIQWDEPFGLSFVEAMACGTPVVALKRGAVPEIVMHNKTGFIGDSIDQMVRYCGLIDKIGRAECRKRAEYFTVAKMVDNYEKVFMNFLKHG